MSRPNNIMALLARNAKADETDASDQTLIESDPCTNPKTGSSESLATEIASSSQPLPSPSFLPSPSPSPPPRSLNESEGAGGEAADSEGEQGEEEEEEEENETTTAKPVTFGFGPMLNGIGVPLVNKDFEPLTIVNDESDNVYILLDTWIFKVFGNRNLQRKSFKKTETGIKIANALEGCIGRHTRTFWLVDKERKPPASMKVNIDDVEFEFLPKLRTYAAKFSSDVLHKFADIARQEIEGKLNGQRRIRKSDQRNLIRSAAADALTLDDIANLKVMGVKWHPSKLRFCRNGECFTYVKIKATTKTKYKSHPKKLRAFVMKQVRKMKEAFLQEHFEKPCTSDNSDGSATADLSDES